LVRPTSRNTEVFIVASLGDWHTRNCRWILCRVWHLLFRASRSVWGPTCLLLQCWVFSPRVTEDGPWICLSSSSVGFTNERAYNSTFYMLSWPPQGEVLQYNGENSYTHEIFCVREIYRWYAQRDCESRMTCFPHETAGNGTQIRERILPGCDQIFSRSKYLYPYSCQVSE
jgi:hypothetical protein